MARVPKPLTLPGSEAPVASPETQGHGPRALSIPVTTATNPPVTSGGPRPLNAPDTPKPRGGNPRPLGSAVGSQGTTKIDVMLNDAISKDTALEKFKFRIKPRLETLIKSDDDDMLNWGERNLVALRTVTQSKATIAARISQINPSQWIDGCTTASCKPPSLMGRLFGNLETPQYYETKISQIRDELAIVIKELRKLQEEITPDVEDLQMDIAALQIILKHEPNRFDMMISDGRLRTLIAAQQTVVMAVTALDQFKSTCAQYIQTIDKLLQVTIPNWALANSQQR
jgi:hypothetical protein